MYELFPGIRDGLLHDLHRFVPSLGEGKLEELEKVTQDFGKLRCPDIPLTLL